MRVLPGLGERLLHGLVERVRTQVGAVLYLQLEASQCAHAANGGGGEDHGESTLATRAAHLTNRARDVAPRALRGEMLVQVGEGKKDERPTRAGSASTFRQAAELHR